MAARLFLVFLCLALCSALQATELSIIEKKLDIDGTTATVFAIVQPDGTPGIRIEKGKGFDVELENKLNVPTSVHWHGLILPNNQDGVAFITQFALYPGQAYRYQFPLTQAGTFWMHSHLGLQEQKLLSAPLILVDPSEPKVADEEVVLFLADFSFQSPDVIFEKLRCRREPPMKMDVPDLVEVDYAAYLTNWRTLKSPEIVKVTPGDKIRLRVINGASATNFFIHLGQLKGEVIAIDGNRTKPLLGSDFELADAQRIDILVDIPETGGAFPILAQAEGTDRQTGLILATQGSALPSVSEKATNKAGALTNAQEGKLEALNPLPPKQVDRQLTVELGGDMETYAWTINGQAWPESTPLIVKKGERVEVIFKNRSTMSHPMHLHGHVFQVKAIDGNRFEGALRDTVLVTPNSTLTIQFDANNPGVWPFHCHILYHMEAGMFTVIRYADFQQPLSLQ